MIKILYFARLKESLKFSSEDFQLTENIVTVADLMAHLSARGDAWGALFAGKTNTRAAINHALVENTTVIKAGDEVAFFPPVTGG